MSVTNRKMFRRDARNKLRNMGGIMASSEPLIQEVAKYQFGGGVDILSEIRNMRPEIRSAFLQSLGNPPKRTGTRSQTVVSQQPSIFSANIQGSTLSGQPTYSMSNQQEPIFLKDLNRRKIFEQETQDLLARQNLNRIIGKAKSLGFLEKPNVSKSEVEDFIRSETGTPFFEASDAFLKSLSGPSQTRYGVLGKELLKYSLLPGVATADVLKKTNEFLSETPDSTVEGILAGDVPLPAGVDIIALGANSGLSDDRLRELGVPIDQINAMKKVRTEGLGELERKVSVVDEEAQEAEKERLKEQEAFRKQEDIRVGRIDVDPEAARIQEQLRFRAEEDKTKDQYFQGEPSKTPDPNRREKPESFPETGTLGVTADQGTEAKLAAESKKVLDGEGNVDNVKNQISDVVKTGVGTKGALKQLMKEFTDNAPEYKGLDRGLAIAKIGFAMAAGESPNAITNIAKALSDGADMFIADNAKRDAFNRQVQLSALQYGLGEISKQRTQARADARTFTEFAVGDKPVTWKGTTYQPGQSIRISNQDYFNNGGKLPPGLISEKLLTANQSALNARLKANATLSKKLLEMKSMTITEQKAFVDDFAALHRKASQAETAGTLIESVIKRAPNVVGLGPALQSAGARFTALFGYNAPAGWNTRDLTVQDLTAALQSVIPATLGETQSANSISDRDVSLLIQSFISGGIITQKGDEPGIFNFATTTQEKFINSLQNGLRAVRQAQVGALTEMTAIENQMLYLLTPDQRIGSSALDPIKRTGIFTPGGTGAEGFTLGSMNLGDDGIWDITI
jgi:hypothetical protein